MPAARCGTRASARAHAKQRAGNTAANSGGAVPEEVSHSAAESGRELQRGRSMRQPRACKDMRASRSAKAASLLRSCCVDALVDDAVTCMPPERKRQETQTDAYAVMYSKISADASLSRDSRNTNVVKSASAGLLSVMSHIQSVTSSSEAAGTAGGLASQKLGSLRKTSAARVINRSKFVAKEASQQRFLMDFAVEQKGNRRHLPPSGRAKATPHKRARSTESDRSLSQDSNPGCQPSPQPAQNDKFASCAREGCRAKPVFATRRAARACRLASMSKEDRAAAESRGWCTEKEESSGFVSRRSKKAQTRVRCPADDGDAEVMPEIIQPESTLSQPARKTQEAGSIVEFVSGPDVEKMISVAEERIAQYLENTGLLLSGKQGFDDACATLTKLQKCTCARQVGVSSRLDSLVEKCSALDEKRLSLELKRWLIGGPRPTLSPVTSAM